MIKIGDHIQSTGIWFHGERGIIVNIVPGAKGHWEKHPIVYETYLYDSYANPKGKRKPCLYYFAPEWIKILEPLSLEFFLTHDDPYMRELGIKFSEIQHVSRES